MRQTQVQLRVPGETVRELDRWIEEGRFANRSDAIKTVLALYEERQRTREFARMLLRRSDDARSHPEKLVPLGR